MKSWAYVSERSRRLWDEMVPPPTRKIGVRLTTTYAGFTGESALLEELYSRGMRQLEIGPDLRAGDGMLFFWSHTPIAPWQTEAWLAAMRRSLRPNAYLRLVENRFVGSEFELIDLQSWDACVDPAAKPVLADRLMSVWVGVDAASSTTQRRSSPSPGTITSRASSPIAFSSRGPTIRSISSRPSSGRCSISTSAFASRRSSSIPTCFIPSCNVSRAKGIDVEEFPQTTGNLTDASQNLFEVIRGRNITVYPAR